MGMRVIPDEAALEAALNSAAMQQRMRRAAEMVARRAAEISPVRSGRYKRSWRVESGVNGGPTGRTAWGRIINDTPYAIYVERGNSRGAPAQRVLRRASEVLR